MFMDSKPIKSVYLIGIAGTGMGAFAGLLKAAGYDVSGSDSAIYPPMSVKLQEWGINVKTPYATRNIEPVPDLVIVGNVASKDNVEATYVREQQLPSTSFPEALSHLFLADRRSAVIAGTHGKTTTSALMAHTLHHAGHDPSFLIGGIPQNFGESFHLGRGASRFFVIEGDEYDTAYFDKRPKFLHYRPHFLLCTSLEYDHADIYANVEEIVARFSELLTLVPLQGKIVVHADAPWLKIAREKNQLRAPLTSYGKGGDYFASNEKEDARGISFDVCSAAKNLGRVSLQLSGPHNRDNALGAYVLLSSMGLHHEEIVQGFATFKGVKRRLEEIGEKNGILVVDDFAHHPTAVEFTLMGARKRYEGRPLWALFEPRSASSCRNIFQKAYAKSFHAADRVLIAPPGRELDKKLMLDVNLLANDITSSGIRAQAFASQEEMIKTVVNECPPHAVLLCMSNGAFGNIHVRLLDAI